MPCMLANTLTYMTYHTFRISFIGSSLSRYNLYWTCVQQVGNCRLNTVCYILHTTCCHHKSTCNCTETWVIRLLKFHSSNFLKSPLILLCSSFTFSSFSFSLTISGYFSVSWFIPWWQLVLFYLTIIMDYLVYLSNIPNCDVIIYNSNVLLVFSLIL